MEGIIDFIILMLIAFTVISVERRQKSIEKTLQRIESELAAHQKSAGRPKS